MSIRVALVDDHAQFRSCLAGMLSRQGVAIVFEADDGPTAARALADCVPSALPDVLLMDVDLPRGAGIDATRRIARRHPQLRIVALSMHDEPRLIEAITAAGADACVRKGEPLPVLLDAIRGSRF